MVIVEHLENTDKNNEESMKNLRRPHAETPDAPGDSAFTGLPSHSPPRNRVAGSAPCRPRGRGGAHSTPSGRSPWTARTLAASVVTADRAPGDFRRRWLGGGICSGRASGRRWPSCRPLGLQIAALLRQCAVTRCSWTGRCFSAVCPLGLLCPEGSRRGRPSCGHSSTPFITLPPETEFTWPWLERALSRRVPDHHPAPG